MNSPMIHDLSLGLAESVDTEAGPADRIAALYRRILARNPSPKELDLAITYLNQGTIDQYAQVLLATTEEIFWP